MIGPNERWGSDFFVLFFPELPLNPSGKFWAEACCLAPAEDWPGIFFSVAEVAQNYCAITRERVVRTMMVLFCPMETLISNLQMW
jgi:hypothetical protein